MEAKVKELVERVRLTPEEIISAEERGAKYYKDLVAAGVEVYSRDGLIAAIHKFITEAQLNKVLNDSDLALIDREREEEEIKDRFRLNPRGFRDAYYHPPVIPLKK